MKHIFKYIDIIEILLKHMPTRVDNPADKKKAEQSLDNIEKYAKTIKKILENHRTNKYIQKLEKTEVEEVSTWAEKVEKLFKYFDTILDIIKHDMVILRTILKEEPHVETVPPQTKWGSAIRDMHLGIIQEQMMQAEEDMSKARNYALCEIHEIEGIIDVEEHENIENLLELFDHIEKLQVGHKDVPVKLNSKEDIGKALAVCDETLKKVTEFEEHVKKHRAHIQSLKDSYFKEAVEWEKRMEIFYDQLVNLIFHIKNTVVSIREVALTKPNTWEKTILSLSLGIYEKQAKKGKEVVQHFKRVQFLPGSNEFKHIIDFEEHITHLLC